MIQSKKFKMKICLLGDGAVGKTSLVNKFVNNMFHEEYILTVGTRTSKKSIFIQNHNLQYEAHLDMLIWDIMGQMSFRKLLHPDYLMGAKGAILVCDLTRKETLDNLDEWIDSLYIEGEIIPTVFVANKCDRVGDMEFGAEDIEKVASIYDSPVFVTSAKTGEKVENVFESLGQKILSNTVFDTRPSPISRTTDQWTYTPMEYDSHLFH